jgi:hypothetical protein
MSDLKERFSRLTSEYLLELRARGDGLSDEAHQTIEAIFAERGEHLPARPKEPIVIDNNAGAETNIGRFFKSAALIILALFVLGMAKQLAHTWIGVLITIGVVIYVIANWVRRQNLAPAEREREANEKEANDECLTEIMTCAANGNLERVRELVEYGADVNATSLSGNTALMYAARNNHLAIVEYLLAAGADARVKSDKKSTAADIARRFGHLDIVAILEQHVA